MNIMKYMCLAGLFFPIAAVAQQDKTLCDFETPESYKSVRAYDTCPTSPFNLSNLKGNVQVVENDLNAEDSELGFAPNGSNYILGVQRARVFAGSVQGNRFVSLAKGVYIVADKKIVVK